MFIPLLSSRLLVMLLTLFASGCTFFRPVRGYAGPERPLLQVSLIRAPAETFQLYGESGFEKSIASVDGKEFEREGILVLPGVHLFKLSFKKLEKEYGCVSGRAADGPAYRSCMEDDGNRRAGVCAMYLDSAMKTQCLVLLTNYSCSGSLTAKAGRKYLLSAFGAQSPEMTAIEMAIDRDAFILGTDTMLTNVGKCDSLGSETRVRESTLKMPGF